MKRVAIIVIIGLFFTSCVITMSYKSGKLRKSYSSNYRKAQKILSLMKKDFNKRKNLYNSLSLKYEKLLSKDYSKLNNLLEKMSNIINKVEKDEKNYRIVRDDIYRLTENRKKIKSNKPEWEKYNKIEDRAKILNSRLEKLSKNYRKLSKNYNHTFKRVKKSIFKIEKKRRK